MSPSCLDHPEVLHSSECCCVSENIQLRSAAKSKGCFIRSASYLKTDLLRFVWCDMRREDPPNVFEWQVLPFCTTCSPCCAIFALQKHVLDNSEPGDSVLSSVEWGFYVDNCLQALPTTEKARHLVDRLRALVASGGFKLC